MIKSRATNAIVHATTQEPRRPSATLNVDDDDDEEEDPKYVKRRRQKKQKRFFILLMIILGLLSSILVILLIVLVFDIHSLQSRSNTDYETNSVSTSLKARLRSNKYYYDNRQSDSSRHPAVAALDELEDAIQHNLPSSSRIRPELLVPLDSEQAPNPLLSEGQPKVMTPKFSVHGQFFRVSRLLQKEPMQWQLEWEQWHKAASGNERHPRLGTRVDYTQEDLYDYPPKLSPPPLQGYPLLRPLSELFSDWPQTAIDHPPRPIREVLQHFDFQTELDDALLYRQRKLPFKLTNVPELLHAQQKWTDDYVSQQFDGDDTDIHAQPKHSSTILTSTTAQGKCQESRHSFFAFFQPHGWNVERMGLPPTRNNDWTFRQWAEHARFADATQLEPNRPHFYWQASVAREERELPPSTWSFISKDLPSFSSPNATFICHQPSEQKGIQCRFGERGVTAATHFDAGQNMVGMIAGAKRYILHPPRECHKLGIVTSRKSALFRHSLLNFGHYETNDVEEEEKESLSDLEQQWLERAETSMAVETVLKAGEILFIPSHWFHYIIGLQKNAQCNVRSGVDGEGDEEFGGAMDVSEERCDATRQQR